MITDQGDDHRERGDDRAGRGDSVCVMMTDQGDDHRERGDDREGGRETHTRLLPPCVVYGTVLSSVAAQNHDEMLTKRCDQTNTRSSLHAVLLPEQEAHAHRGSSTVGFRRAFASLHPGQ